MICSDCEKKCRRDDDTERGAPTTPEPRGRDTLSSRKGHVRFSFQSFGCGGGAAVAHGCMHERVPSKIVHGEKNKWMSLTLILEHTLAHTPRTRAALLHDGTNNQTHARSRAMSQHTRTHAHATSSPGRGEALDLPGRHSHVSTIQVCCTAPRRRLMVCCLRAGLASGVISLMLR